jgi:hypothetical protein
MDIYADGAFLKMARERLQIEKKVKLAFLNFDHYLSEQGFEPEEEQQLYTIFNALKARGYIYIPVTTFDYTTYLKKGTVPPSFPQPYIILTSTGSKIHVRQENGEYLEDRNYANETNISAKTWRQIIYSVIESINTDETIATILTSNTGTNDEFNIEVECDSLFKKNQFIQRLLIAKLKNVQYPALNVPPSVLQKTYDIETLQAAFNITFNDKSHPENHIYRFVITPLSVTPTKAVEHVIKTIARSLEINTESVRLLTFGSHFLDFEMILRQEVLTDSSSVVIIPSDSPISTYLRTEDQSFAGEDFSFIKRYLKAQERHGFYSYQTNDNIKMIINAAELKRPTKGLAALIEFLYPENQRVAHYTPLFQST